MSIDLGATELQVALEDRERRFHAFVDSRRERAVRLAFRLLRGDQAAAEDVAQEAFLRAYRALPRFREQSSLNTWFYRILVREAQRHRRWQAVRRTWNGSGADEAGVPGARAPGMGDPGLRKRIVRALEGLSRRQREAFVLVHLEGFTVNDAATLLGKPPGTVKSHLHRALRSLRSALADLREPESGETSVFRKIERAHS